MTVIQATVNRSACARRGLDLTMTGKLVKTLTNVPHWPLQGKPVKVGTRVVYFIQKMGA